jgi:hypothetical protein
MPKAYIPLPRASRLRELLSYNPETGRLRWKVARGNKSAGAPAGTRNGIGSFSLRLNDTGYLLHRIAWAVFTGKDPGANKVDHINGNRLDNRASNLRLVCADEKNPMLGDASGLLCVSWHRVSRKWQAEIIAEGRETHLGYFDSLGDAMAARQKA